MGAVKIIKCTQCLNIKHFVRDPFNPKLCGSADMFYDNFEPVTEADRFETAVISLSILFSFDKTIEQTWTV